MTEELKLFMINASGNYLTELLPEDFNMWSEERLHKFIQENLWQPLEGYYDFPEQVYTFIENSAYSTMKFVNELNLKGEKKCN